MYNKGVTWYVVYIQRTKLKLHSVYRGQMIHISSVKVSRCIYTLYGRRNEVKMRVDRSRLVKGLKVVEWLLKQPQFTILEKNVYLRGEHGTCYLGVAVQDLHFEMPLAATEEVFQIALPNQTILNIVSHMDAVIEIEIEDTVVYVSDSLQRVRIQQTVVLPIPPMLELAESDTWECVSLLKHLQEVAMEQDDEADLSVSFTGQYASIGNYMYVKRTPFVSSFGLTLPYAVARLLIACAKIEAEEAIQIGIHANQQLVCVIGDIYIATNLYSTLLRDVHSVFQQVRGNYRAKFDTTHVQSVLTRIQRMTKEEALELEFMVDGGCRCRVQDDMQTTEITLPSVEVMQAFPEAIKVQVDRAGLYHLLRKTLSTMPLLIGVDTETECLHISTDAEEMVISVLIG